MPKDDETRPARPPRAPRQGAGDALSSSPWATAVPPDEDLDSLGPLARNSDRETAGTRHACALAAQRAARAGTRAEAPADPSPAHELTELDAVRAYCRAWNTLDVSHLEPLLADTVRYTSQAVLEEMAGKPRLLAYLRAKMKTIAGSPEARVFAEVGETRPYPMAPNPPRVCAVVAQGAPDDIEVLAFMTVKGGRIARIDLAHVCPIPSTAWRSGEYPGAETGAVQRNGGDR